MTSDDKYKNQNNFIARRKAEGLERLVLWVKPEHKEAFKLLSRQPHAISRHLAAFEREFKREVAPKVKERIENQLARKTRRAMIVQKRAQARRLQAGSNQRPEMVRFKYTPPGAFRNRLKEAGWIYDPIRVVWMLPDDSETWHITQKLINEADPDFIELLIEPLD